MRRAQPLQHTPLALKPALYLNQMLADTHQLKSDDRVNVIQGSDTLILPVVVHAAVPDDTVFFPRGFKETSGLADAIGQVTLTKVVA